MPANPDGTAACDRCGTYLDGYGVLYGLITSDIDPLGAARERIYCYTYPCRDAVLDTLIVFPDSAGCATCDVQFAARGTGEAMMTADLNPDGSGLSRNLAFCYINGHRDQLFTQGVL